MTRTRRATPPGRSPRPAPIRAGDFNEPATLTAAASGADTAIVMSTPLRRARRPRPARDRRIEAVKAAAVPRHLFVGRLRRRGTGIPHFAQFAVEQHLAASGVDYSISAPVWFMENLASPWMTGSLLEAPSPSPSPSTARSGSPSHIGVPDHPAERRAEVFGRRIDIAGDEIAGETMARTIGNAAGAGSATTRCRSMSCASRARLREDVPLVRCGRLQRRHRRPPKFPEVGWHNFADWAAAYDWNSLGTWTAKAA